MSIVNSGVLKKVADIMSDTAMSAGKKTQKIGEIIKGESKLLQVTPNTKAAMINIGKWGGIAAAGIGAGIGIGGGSMAASAGISHAFGLDFSTEEKKQESVMKITGWFVFLAILVLAVWFIWPRVKKVMK